MFLEIEEYRKALVVRPTPRRLEDMQILKEIRALPRKFAMDKCQGILLDLSGVDFINSTGISALLGCSKGLCHEHKGMVLYGLQPQVHNLFEVSRLMNIMVIRANREEALNTLEHWKQKTREQLTRDNYRPDSDMDYVPPPPAFLRGKRKKGIKEKKDPSPKPASQKPKSSLNFPPMEEEIKERLDPLFDAIRNLRDVASQEGIDLDLNTNIGQMIVQFVQKVKQKDS